MVTEHGTAPGTLALDRRMMEPGLLKNTLRQTVLLVFLLSCFGFFLGFFSPTDQSHEPLSLKVKALSAIGTLISSFVDHEAVSSASHS